jgi:hypothetical protein
VVGRRCELGRCARGRLSADCGLRGCVGCAQKGDGGRGGVVRMLDGAVTFKGGTISNTKAVHAPARCDFTSALHVPNGRAALRYTRAQGFSGGVLSMDRGTALFDTVAISDTEALHESVRRCKSCRWALGRVSADGVRGRLRGRGCIGCVQDDADYGGGVVGMLGGAITFKGGTISSTTAVRASPLRFHVVRRKLQMPALYAACCARWCVPRGGYSMW